MRKSGRIATLVRLSAWANLGAVLAVLVALRSFGESWWLLTVILYLPRIGFALPLLVIVPALWLVGPRKLLFTQLAAALVVLFPLMGLSLKLPATPPPAPHVRLLSYNIWYGWSGLDKIAREIEDQDPDVVLLQATSGKTDEFFGKRFADRHVKASYGFMIISKYPVRDAYEPPTISREPFILSGFARYTVDTPLGPLDLYDLHLQTPRAGINGVRYHLRQILRTASAAGADENVEAATDFRRQQLKLVLDDAARRSNRVVLAGDTNLPGLSPTYRELTARFTDAFSSVGSGFGYTFPANHLRPWLRIDRILLGPGLHAQRFTVGGRGGSDHCPVIAELAADH